MGDFRVREIRDANDRHRMYHYALEDIEAFKTMWQNNAFTDGPIHIGAEQELCIVDKYGNPTKSALDILDKIDDDHYTNELALYNLEINLDPELLNEKCFSVVESKLLHLLQKGQTLAKEQNEYLVLTGILPTIDTKHLEFDYMTPIPRYKTLSQMLYNIRGGKFEIYLQGVDDLMASLGSVLFEACNTSFQTHLQIKPSEFVDKFNWAQMISGPVLSCCVNSPLVLGRELWAESRIAIFKQSLDTRNSKNHLRKKLPRVYFGNDWLSDSPVNLWKNELIRFPLIITSDDLTSANEELRQGRNPDLRAIRLHNGTTYTWNRLCYGSGKDPHLRIECRYMPSGPSALDEISNFAFWVGIMNAMPEDWSEQVKSISFKEVKGNFIKAARTGLSSIFTWKHKTITAKDLLLNHLIPLAEKGLSKASVAQEDIDKYLTVIVNRVKSEQTGAQYLVDNYRAIAKKHDLSSARQELVARSIEYQKDNIPISEWPSNENVIYGLGLKYEKNVSQAMSTDILTVNEDTSIELVQQIMNWKNIHHLPVENYKGDLIGIITDGMVSQINQQSNSPRFAKDFMKQNVISINKEASISQLKDMLQEYGLSGIPVTHGNRLVGMITSNDL